MKRASIQITEITGRLSNEQVIQIFSDLVQTERKITHIVLQYIAEIDRRKIYLDHAYPNLFEFLTKKFAYSPGAAQRRIDSARLLREIPEISSKIEEGKVTLSQLSKMQQAVRHTQKRDSVKVSKESKLKLIERIELKTNLQTDAILSESLSLPIPQSREQHHRNDQVTLTITLSKEQMADLQTAKQILGHTLDSTQWDEVITHLAKHFLYRKDRRTTATAAAVKLASKNQGCQFVNYKTGEICGSGYFLEIDHKIPKWAGGTDSPENLQILCSNHNKHKYRKEAGINLI